MRDIYHLRAYKILYLTIYFVFKRSCSIFWFYDNCPEENCPPTLNLNLILTQALTLTGGGAIFRGGDCPDTQFFRLYRDIFSTCPFLEVPFPKLQVFSEIFWALPIYSLCEKTILEIFVYLFISKVTSTEGNSRFYKQCSQAAARLICERAIFGQNTSIVFSAKIRFRENQI